jgi:hypothetical protein
MTYVDSLWGMWEVNIHYKKDSRFPLLIFLIYTGKVIYKIIHSLAGKQGVYSH